MGNGQLLENEVALHFSGTAPYWLAKANAQFSGIF